MEWETLPSWFWAMYYLFLLVTLGLAIVNTIKKKFYRLSVMAIMLCIMVPVVSMMNSVDRAKGMNEMDHLAAQLQQGSIWSIFAAAGFTYLCGYWVYFIMKRKVKAKVY
ncbi:hypothetical protein [Bacillus dakarensis]|uniref:hypothetical protein n=1 Tax=Robertmurraya dakarensis TaxID=1926278 RepID=UPI00098194E9|nr:hypothetical protein [Bacillus dakarensis]